MRNRELTITLLETIARHEMFSPGQTVVVGISGGPDSTALLHALAGWREAGNIQLVAAHLHHGFRGEEADGDAAYVEELAARLDVPCFVERVDVPAMKRRRHLSAQEAAREARHAFLRRVAAKCGAERIALGHTQDDRVETILLNLLRGTGPEGLRGFPPVDFPIARPLYDVRRAEVEAYCVAHDLELRRDSSNAKTDYRRNRVRVELIPHFAAYYNAGIHDSLLRMSELISADNALLASLAASASQEIVREQTADSLTLDSAILRDLPLALQRRVLRQAIETMRGDLQNIRFEFVEKALHSLHQKQDFAATLPQNSVEEVRLSVNAQRIMIYRVAAPDCLLPRQEILAVPGETKLGIGKKVALSVFAREFATGAEAIDYIGKRLAEEERREAFRTGRWIALPIDAVTLPLVARSWRPGDRLRPHGLNGTKKLQDIFTDAKLPAAQRPDVPVLAEAGGAGEILAVIGVRTSERALSFEETAAWTTPLWLLEWREEANVSEI